MKTQAALQLSEEGAGASWRGYLSVSLGSGAMSGSSPSAGVASSESEASVNALQLHAGLLSWRSAHIDTVSVSGPCQCFRRTLDMVTRCLHCNAEVELGTAVAANTLVVCLPRKLFQDLLRVGRSCNY
jgi:hypothetical protein